MAPFYLVMFFAILSYSAATHHHKLFKDHHHEPHHETHVEKVIAVLKSLPPPLPKIPPPNHHTSHVLHKPIPIPVFPLKPIQKHNHKDIKFIAPPIVKPVPIPVPVPVHDIKHHAPLVPLELAAKPLVPFGKGHKKIKVHEHIDERYIY